MPELVMCIGDSSALPRPGIPYEETWYYLLSRRFADKAWYPFFRRGATTELLGAGGGSDGFPRGGDCLELYSPDRVVLQLGIVDCAPRLFRERGFEQRLMARMPSGMRRRYIEFVKKHRRRSTRRRWVGAARFEANVRDFLVRCRNIGVKRILVIAIAIPDDSMQERNEDLAASCREYNAILEKLCGEFPEAELCRILDGEAAKGLYIDGYHPGTAGHRRIFDHLSPYFEAAE